MAPNPFHPANRWQNGKLTQPHQGDNGSNSRILVQETEFWFRKPNLTSPPLGQHDGDEHVSTAGALRRAARSHLRSGISRPAGHFTQARCRQPRGSLLLRVERARAQGSRRAVEEQLWWWFVVGGVYEEGFHQAAGLPRQLPANPPSEDPTLLLLLYSRYRS